MQGRDETGAILEPADARDAKPASRIGTVLPLPWTQNDLKLECDCGAKTYPTMTSYQSWCFCAVESISLDAAGADPVDVTHSIYEI